MSITSLLTLLDHRVDARYARWSRILLGCAALLVGLDQWVILIHVLDPERMQLPFLHAVPRLPADQLPIIIGVWFSAAIGLIVGRHTVIPGSMLVGVMSYAMLLDQQAYSNHLYLLILLTLLVTVAESTAANSVDGRTVAAWPLLLMKLQLTIVYGYSVLFKLNPVFLNGDTIGSYIRSDGPLPIPTALQTPEMLKIAAVATLVAEAFLAVAFWIPSLRRPALVLGLVFHAMLIWTTHLGRMVALTAFGLEIMAMYVLFVNLPGMATIPRRLSIALPGSAR